MALKVKEIQDIVKNTVFDEIKTHFAENGEQFADFSIAVPVTVDGTECWAKVSVVCGQLKDTKTSKAFNPFEVANEWQADKEIKAKLQAEKEKAKAEKIARSQSKKKD